MIFAVAATDGGKRSDEIIAAYRAKYDLFAETEDLEGLISDIAQSLGVDDAAFDAAVKNQALVQRLTAVRDQAMDEFGVQGTPSFFLDGKPVPYNGTINSFATAIDSETHAP